MKCGLDEAGGVEAVEEIIDLVLRAEALVGEWAARLGGGADSRDVGEAGRFRRGPESVAKGLAGWAGVGSGRGGEGCRWIRWEWLTSWTGCR